MKTVPILLMRRTMLVIACLASVVATSSFGQGFWGHWVQLRVYYPNLSSPISVPTNAVVGSGPEFDNIPPLALPGYFLADVTIDLSAYTIDIGFTRAGNFTFASATFNGWVLSDVSNSIPGILSVSIDTNVTNLAGFDATRVSFTPEQVAINVQGLHSLTNSRIRLNVMFEPSIVAIAQESNDIRLTFKTVATKTNFLQATSGTADGSYSNNFTDISPVIIAPGAGSIITNYLDVGGATNRPSRYYRVRLVP